ncbi:MAG: DUF4430 domain-containing protein [Oscillospiraceae bacterium]|jgi:hypothetical protein|nr:DUF4430 domain-containing protein [Oscillospiraceae bacterium]
MKAKTIFLLLAMTVLIFTVACDTANDAPDLDPNSDPQPQEQSGDVNTSGGSDGLQDIGEGATVFLFEMTDDEGNVSSWNVHTNDTSVGGALVEVGLIEGDVSDFGMMVSHVNGLRADFVEDGAWWAFYIDDEMAMVGVDSTDIEEGVTYAFVYTPA